ncbi:MAG: hypothetical protein ACLS6G_11085, partial [Christensenellales bacterium]
MCKIKKRRRVKKGKRSGKAGYAPFLAFSRHRQRAILPLRENDSQFVDISKLGLDSKIKKFIYSFICRKGYSP